MKKQWIDIMFGDRWHRKFKYTIDTTFKTWIADLVEYVLTTYPYLRRRKEFDLWFNLPNAVEPCRVVVRPLPNQQKMDVKGESSAIIASI